MRTGTCIHTCIVDTNGSSGILVRNVYHEFSGMQNAYLLHEVTVIKALRLPNRDMYTYISVPYLQLLTFLVQGDTPVIT